MSTTPNRRSQPRRLLLVSQRPIDYGGGGSVRWLHLSRALPSLGWIVTAVSAWSNPTANEASTNPRLAMLAAARARAMTTIGDALRPMTTRMGVQPEALAPNLLWAVTGRRRIAEAIRRHSPNAVWATSPPQSAILAAVPVARRANLPVVAELRDLWAGNPYFDNGGGLLARIEAASLRNANAVVTVTSGFRSTIEELHPELRGRVRVITNGFDPKLPGLRNAASRPPARRKATLIHAGTLYGDRTAARLISALARDELRDRVRLELLGPVDAETRAAVHRASHELEVSLNPPVSWSAAIERVCQADISVVIVSPGTGGDTMIPGKLYETLALGKPVLALTPPGSASEVFLRDLGQGAGVVQPDDESAIAGAVWRLLDKVPEPVPLDRLAAFNRDTIAGEIVELLDSLVVI